MYIACRKAARRGRIAWRKNNALRVPIEAPKLGVDKYIDLMGLDKKVVDGKIRLVLQQGIGKSVVTSDYPAEILRQTLALA